MQLLNIKYQKDISFEEPICKLVSGENNKLWNNEWANDSVKNVFMKNKIINYNTINKLSTVIKFKEVSLYKGYYF